MSPSSQSSASSQPSTGRPADSPIRLPIRITGMGRYLPRRIVSNAEVEALLGMAAGTIDRTNAGVTERRWVEEDETHTLMATEACKEALSDADLEPGDVDLIINGSGTQRQAVPDGAPYIQAALGLGRSAIPAFSVHSTCLSWLLGLDLAAQYIASGRHKRVLVVSAEQPSRSLNLKETEAACLFGDAAMATVVEHAGDSGSGIESIRFETYGDGADLTSVPGGGTLHHPNDPETTPEHNLFHMDGAGILKLATRYLPRFLGRLDPSLLQGGTDIDWVIAHQPSMLGLRVLRHFGYPDAKVGVTIDHLGNCGSVSMPATLYEMVKDGRVQRGQRLFFIGTGAGLGFGGAQLIW